VTQATSTPSLHPWRGKAPTVWLLKVEVHIGTFHKVGILVSPLGKTCNSLVTISSGMFWWAYHSPSRLVHEASMQTDMPVWVFLWVSPALSVPTGMFSMYGHMCTHTHTHIHVFVSIY
jgi:hypothetical protein